MRKMIREEEIYCPLLKRVFDEELCADAALAAEGFHPERFAPSEIKIMANWQVTCQTCKNNPCNEETQ